MQESLARDGYVVLKGRVTEEQCDALQGQFFDYMEHLNPEFRRDDRKTWSAHLPLSTNGLIQSYGVGFQRFAIDARKLLKPVFAELYDTEDLVCSFDGASCTAPTTRPRYKDLKAWKVKSWDSLHMDQTTVEGRCFQSGLAISTQREDEHVFVCVPGSHLLHEELLKIGNGKPRVPHWEVLGDAQLAHLKKNNLEVIRVPLDRGDIVLWDSRTIHSSARYCSTASREAWRLQLFVCMAPVPAGGVPDKQKRREARAKGLVSKHSPVPIRLFGKPRLYSTAQAEKHDRMMKRVKKDVEMTEEEEKLYGLN